MNKYLITIKYTSFEIREVSAMDEKEAIGQAQNTPVDTKEIMRNIKKADDNNYHVELIAEKKLISTLQQIEEMEYHVKYVIDNMEYCYEDLIENKVSSLMKLIKECKVYYLDE